jgi:two-component system chemotaxis response regulator CheB
MDADRIIAVGTSSGGVDALRTLVSGLPGDFATPICVVQHIGAHAPGILHQILARAGPVPTFKVEQDMPLRAPGIYTARPDFHLVIENAAVRITKGPRENRFRPAIDPLFRSAAATYGRGAIGVVLTGDLDDGTSGLLAIKQQGGVAVVQDPNDAVFPSMPRSALRHVPVDHVVPVADLASLLVSLTATPLEDGRHIEVPAVLETEVTIAAGGDAREAGVMRLGEPSTYACPDCHGVLLEVHDDGVPRFRCHTGHAYSIESLADALSEGIEDTAWSAVRALDESSSLLERLERLNQRAGDDAGDDLRSRSRNARQRADQIRRLLGGT